ncbi:hypothetical protein WYI_13942 [Ochrobactrum sp. CDB2]|nr:hypothetical protein WYI_13942 [Ochrobactrum sp. CDB2]
MEQVDNLHFGGLVTMVIPKVFIVQVLGWMPMACVLVPVHRPLLCRLLAVPVEPGWLTFLMAAQYVDAPLYLCLCNSENGGDFISVLT